MKLPHLEAEFPVTRGNIRRAYRLNESGCPPYDASPESIHKIIDWLNVEKSERYKANATQTFCNIYAYDYADKLGAYLPRVWWDRNALAKVAKGENVPVVYPKGTVLEMNANAIYDWFRVRSGNFGWCRIESRTQAQELANKGKCVIMVGANLDRKKSGHIVAIVPETDKHKATGSTGIGDKRTVTVPLQSQAGRTNWKYRAFDWRKNHEPLMMYYWEK